MANRDELLALASRVAAATEGSRELDKEIGLMPSVLNVRHHYTRSLDAALALVPEGWNRRLSEDDNGRWWAELRHGYETSFNKVVGSVQAATPALALCAAALRARAATTVDD